MSGAIPPETYPDPSTWRGHIIWVPDTQDWREKVLGVLKSLSYGYWWDKTDENWQNARDMGLQIVLRYMEGDFAIMDVRQNATNKALLQKTYDGVDWTTWANIQEVAPNIRFNSGKLQYYDGSNWVDIPNANDERTTGDYTPQWPEGSVPLGETGQCLAAENIVAIYDTTVVQMQAGFDAGKLAAEVVTAIAGILAIFMPVEAVVFEFLGMVTAAFSAGSSAISDLHTSATLNILKCALQQHGQNDGSFTAGNFGDILSYIDDHLGDGFTKSYIMFWLDTLGPVGLSRMAAAAGIDSGDCECGDWCKRWDFTASNGGFVALTNSNGTYGAWSGGSGWQPHHFGPPDFSDQEGLNIGIEVNPDFDINYVKIVATCSSVTGDNSLSVNDGYHTGTAIASFTFVEGEHTYEWSGNRGTSGGLTIEAGMNGTSTIYIKELTIHGPNRPNPFGSDNC